MMRNLLKNVLILALLSGATNALAQKIDQRLTKLVEQVAKSRGIGENLVDLEAASKQIVFEKNADGTINSLSAIALLKEGAECPTEELEQMGIKVRFVLGDMVALVIPADKLMALENIEAFSHVRADERGHIMNEEARKATGVEQVNTAEAAAAQSLPKAYTGAGVVVGVIDAGIDFNHAAFRNADGSTRIKRAWDVKTKKDYTEDEIKTLTSDETTESHGSHTSAIAAGSPTSNGQQGMAPEADLYLCGVGAGLATTDVVECMTKIFKYAEEVGKPAVINMSIGDILGLHDGSEAWAKAAATLTNNGTAKGRVVVISTGNSTTNYQSIAKKVHTNTSVAGGWQLATVLGAAEFAFALKPDIPVIYNGNYYIYATDHKDFEVKLAMVDLKTGKISELGNHLLDKDKKTPLAVDKILLKDSKVPTIDGTNAVAYEMSFKVTPVMLDQYSFRLALFIKGSSDGQEIRMMCDGDGYGEPCFNAPKDDGYDFVAAGYTKGNGDIACNTSVCNDYSISVGSYITRRSWKHYKGEESRYPESQLTGKVQELGEISDFSSYCVDDNGKSRPTIIAPGQGLISAINSYDTNFFKKDGEPNTEYNEYDNLVNKVEKHGRDNWYALSQGTSMAAPVVAGIIALWLQANPGLSNNDILEILKETVKNDDYTTNVSKIPSGNKIQAGLGKIDCLGGLKKILKSTGIETVAADGLREATPATMYSVDAPVYNMMGQRVDKSQKGLVIYKGRKYMNR